MAPVEVNTKSVVFATLGAVIIIYMAYSYFPRKSKPAQLKIHNSWKTSSFVDIPQDVIQRAKDVKIVERHSTFSVDGKEHHVFYREALPASRTSQVPLLLLHGASSNSDIWIKSNTLRMGSAFGYRVVALDLPGWGRSERSRIDDNQRARFLERFMAEKHLDRPVIVSPSMSGSYAIPYIMGASPAECARRVRGYVPIAPVAYHLYEPAQYHRCEVPTMIVYGTKDTQLGLHSTNSLRNMANSEVFPMEGAGHPCYTEKTDEWHYYLYNFLKAVERED